VPDASTKRALATLKAAGHPVRLQILLRAAKNGSLRMKEAKQITGGAAGSGTPTYHISDLVTTGLLERVARGEYRATSAGRLVLQLVGLLDNEADRDGGPASEAIAVTVAPDGSFVDDVLPVGAELVAALTRRVRDGDSDETAIVRFLRVERHEGPVHR
jgi:hypothetical protein